MKMTYFKKPDHSYHRIIFEFTDTEMKAVGFEQISIIPSRLEILKVLVRLTGTDEGKREKSVSLEKFCDTPLGIPYGANKGGKSIQDRTGISEMYIIPNNIKLQTIENRLDPDKRYRNHLNTLDLQRKKDAWKAKALRLIGFLNDKDEEIKNLNEIIDYHAG